MPTGSHAALMRNGGEGTADRALRIALAAREAIGHAPNPAASPPDEGAGLWRVIAEIKAIVVANEAAAQRRSRVLLWALGVFGGALLALLAAAAWRLGSRVRIVDQGSDTGYQVADKSETTP